jgi:lipopolysaccharide export system ATP-binding protein
VKTLLANNMAKQINKPLSRIKRPAASTKKIIVEHRTSQTLKRQGTKLIDKQTHQVPDIAVPQSVTLVVNEPAVPQIILRSNGLVKRYKKRAVVDEVSIQVKQGEIVGLLGPNGAGKTTTFYMIVGMIRPNAGKVFMDDVEITKMPMYKRARKGISYLPQEASVFRRLSVRDNLMAILQTTSMTRNEQEEKCTRLMEEFGLAHIAASKGYMLSGGERRRTEIARALALDPKFILLDEPFAGIDPIAVEDIMQIVVKLKKRNIGVLITDHNVHETLSITDRSYLLFEGKILKSGTAEYLAHDPEAKKLYLGENFKLDRYE